MAAYTTIDDPEAYFQTKLYTGSGANQSITLPGDTDMQPDLVWIKDRTNTNNQVWTDSVRGVEKVILSNATNAEATYTDGLTAFNSDGFSLGDDDDGQMNVNTNACVAWCWKAGAGSGTSNTSGTINTTSTSVSTIAGFSISTYTGTGSAATIGHGLGVAPKFIITKRRDATSNWQVGHGSFGWEVAVYLDATDTTNDNSIIWNDTAPTSTVFTVGSVGDANASTGTYVAYCFAEKQGFSKFGSYVGTNNANGPFVYTGFRPAWIIFKPNATADWTICDNKRNPYNPTADKTLNSNLSSAEHDGSMDFDILSNGFKIRNGNSDNNEAGTIIYAAFAEAPLVNSNGVPCNAR